MTYNFKELTVNDLEEIIKKYVNHHNDEEGQWTYALAEKRMKQLFLTPDFYGLGVCNESEMIGFALGWFKQFDDLQLFYLEEILVFKSYQQQGIGSLLLKEVEASVKARGAKKINLLTTYEAKHQNFYSKLGYEKSDFLVPMLKNID